MLGSRPQRLRQSEDEPDHQAAGQQPGRHQRAAEEQECLHPGQAQHRPQPGGTAHADAGPAAAGSRANVRVMESG
jgi:hypothetical protein